MPSGLITPHFSWGESACHCGECEGWNGLEEEVRSTAEWAEKVRLALGGLAIHVNSWVRCPKHNRAIGGEPNSQHLLGRALDFTTKELSPASVQRIMIAHWPGLVKGVGSYRGFCHVDRREGAPARWRG